LGKECRLGDELELRGMPNHSEVGYADYVLFGDLPELLPKGNAIVNIAPHPNYQKPIRPDIWTITKQ